MKMAIASTRAGFALKDELIKYLQGQGHELDDLGMKAGGEFVPYYEAAARVAEAVFRKAVLVVIIAVSLIGLSRSIIHFTS